MDEHLAINVKRPQPLRPVTPEDRRHLAAATVITSPKKQVSPSRQASSPAPQPAAVAPQQRPKRVVTVVRTVQVVDEISPEELASVPADFFDPVVVAPSASASLTFTLILICADALNWDVVDAAAAVAVPTPEKVVSDVTISTVELSEPVVHLADAGPLAARHDAPADVFVGVRDFGRRKSSTEPEEGDDVAASELSVDEERSLTSGDESFDTDEFAHEYSSRGVDDGDTNDDDASLYCDEAGSDGASLLDDLRDENSRLGAVLQRNLESCKALLPEVSSRDVCMCRQYVVHWASAVRVRMFG
jgi:hypothetical protein